MSGRWYWGLVLCALVGAQSAYAQEEGEAAGEAAAPHDWEFALFAAERAPGAVGTVKVTEDDGGSTVRVEVAGLPPVDALDEEGRDVGVYTVWVVPSRERVRESTLAGVLNIDDSGSGQFDLVTRLATFGIIVTATVDGAPERIGGMEVLTGIPMATSPPLDENADQDGGSPSVEPEQPADGDATTEDI